MNKAKTVKPGDLFLVRNFSRTKIEYYFVGLLQVIRQLFNTITLADPKSKNQMNPNVHLMSIVKFNSTFVWHKSQWKHINKK